METTVATIDFDSFDHGSADEKKIVGNAIAEAFRRQGFLKLVNHGIPRHTIEELFRWVFLLSPFSNCTVLLTWSE